MKNIIKCFIVILAIFSIHNQAYAVGSYTVSADTSSAYNYRAVRANTEVVLGAFRFTASSDEDITLRQIAIQLGNTASNSPADLQGQQVTLWDDTEQVGIGQFTTSDYATSTLTATVSITRGETKTIIIKGAFAVQDDVNGTPGAFLAVNYDGDNNGVNGNYGTGVDSGQSISGTSADVSTNGVRIFRNVPTFTVTSSSGAYANNSNLYSFTVSNPGTRDMALSQVTFSVATTGGAATDFTLYADGVAVATAANAPTGTLKVVFDTTSNGKVIPAGSSKTYTLKCANLVDTASVSETLSVALKADASYPSLAGLMGTVANVASSNIVWSPMSTTTLQANDAVFEVYRDWTNGYGLPDFSVDFPTQTFKRVPESPVITDPLQTVYASTTATYTITGTVSGAENGNVQDVYVYNSLGGELTSMGNVMVSDSGSFSMEVDITGADENHFLVVATDQYNQRSATTTVPTIVYDTWAPYLMSSVLGNNASDVQISIGETSLEFSEELSSDSKTAIENALTSNADNALSYSWEGSIITITATEITTFANDVILDISDLAGRITRSVLLIDSRGYIQEAIDAASSGSTITVPVGTYYECLTIDKSLTLTSSDATSTIIDITGCQNGIHIDNADDVNINNFTIKNSGNFWSGDAAAIYVDGTTNSITGLSLSNLSMTENKHWYGIKTASASGQIVNSNIQNSCSGVYLGTGTSDFTVDGNTLNNNGVLDSCHDERACGIDVINSSEITIKNNEIADNDWGILVDSDCEGVDCSSNILVYNNKITGNNGYPQYEIAPYGIVNSGITPISAMMNWWGSTSGPTHTDNTGGTGDIVSDYVNYSPWSGSISHNSSRGTTTINEDGTKKYTIPVEFNGTNGDLQLTIPAGTIITGVSGWDGQINPPTIISTISSEPSQSGYTTAMRTKLEVGYSGGKLLLGKAAKLFFPGEAGKRIGYTRTGESFTEISTACGENSQSWADVNLGIEGDCKIDSGSDLVVWTKHFTQFATFTSTQNSTGGGGGGGGYSGQFNTPIIPSVSFQINSNEGKTYSRDVILNLVTNSPGMKVMFSNSDNFSGAVWEDFVLEKKWTLNNGYGMNYVYMKYKDSSNNISNTKYAGIEYKYFAGNTIVDEKITTNNTTTPKINVTAKNITYNFKRGLDIGSSGEDVGYLQRMLSQDKEVYPEGLITKYFGKLTQLAVRKFQIKYGLATENSPGFGYVGPLTRKKLNNLYDTGGVVENSSTSSNSTSLNDNDIILRAQLQSLLAQLNLLMKRVSN